MDIFFGIVTTIEFQKIVFIICDIMHHWKMEELHIFILEK